MGSGMLTRQDFGDPGGTPLVIAHGLFGSGRNWGAIAKRLSDTRAVVTVDMRNHGTSPWAGTHGYPDLAADLAEVVEGPADFLGHSMGGKAVMQLALTRPDRVRKLVVADIAPMAYGHSQQRMIDAMRSVDLSRVGKRSDADAQLAAVIDEPGVRAFLLQSLDVAERAWRLNLGVLEAEMPKIVGWPDTPGVFDGPALFVTGAESDYVRPAQHAAIRAQFPNARFEAIPGAGHWLHADRPREFEASVRAFLDA
jgi:pimeloyl-ACP methyl ester carboxylesterase